MTLINADAEQAEKKYLDHEKTISAEKLRIREE